MSLRISFKFALALGELNKTFGEELKDLGQATNDNTISNTITLFYDLKFIPLNRNCARKVR
jgi:hypothetical protein